ncbi:hypothetical protein GPK34_00555 [Secundilactobacillus kimchicus]|uniref:hypothetical protein n=1 Tax=Secundilactobacillus kimchicus TaxID=528209 RepID=UPI001C034945|nr:hypothetical protein [Secundilactobacillus kimchicus]MBT9670528.1 hypothetical protein [Secundilactobacillus kimchicus]
MHLTLEERRADENKEKLHARLVNIIHHIRNRCDSPNNELYKNYGGRGVTYDPRWKNNAQFIEDVDSIDGWDERKVLRGELQLDKDWKYEGNKLYSKDTCMWITRKQNMQRLPSRQVPFWAVNLYTHEIEKWVSTVEFSIEYDIGVATIRNVLHKRKHRAGDWTFWYSNENAPTITYVCATKGNKTVCEINNKRLAERIGIDKTTVGRALLRANHNTGDYLITKESVNLGELIQGLETKISSIY